MEGKILILSAKRTNIVDSIVYKLTQERVEYEHKDKWNRNGTKDEIGAIIYIDNMDFEPVAEWASKNKIPVVCVCNKKKQVKDGNMVINYILTNLVDDNNNYTDTQKEFLFRKDIYSLINAKVFELVKDKDEYINGLAIDMRGCKSKYKDWVFDFDSINESYSWLHNKNNNQNPKIEQKVVNFFLDRLYNDSDKEIKYLIEYIKTIRRKKKITDVFVCTKEELEKNKKNHFIRMILKNASESHKIFLVNKDKLVEDYEEIYDKIIYGLIVYEDCIYRDYLDNEYSMGYVDCKKEKVKEYNELFDVMVKKLGLRIKKESDLNEF
jgi:hypothetical protein